jgi:hypothetical protein
MIRIEEIAYHRNGTNGTGFHVVKFTDRKAGKPGKLLGVVFDKPNRVAVFDRKLLTQDVIASGLNSWRGDNYEDDLRKACKGYDRFDWPKHGQKRAAKFANDFLGGKVR